MNSRLCSITKNNLIKLIGIAGTATLFLKIVSNSMATSSYTPIEKLMAKEYEANKEFEKLISVQLITRHGARTPLKLIPGIEEVFINDKIK